MGTIGSFLCHTTRRDQNISVANLKSFSICTIMTSLMATYCSDAFHTALITITIHTIQYTLPKVSSPIFIRVSHVLIPQIIIGISRSDDSSIRDLYSNLRAIIQLAYTITVVARWQRLALAAVSSNVAGVPGELGLYPDSRPYYSLEASPYSFGIVAVVVVAAALVGTDEPYSVVAVFAAVDSAVFVDEDVVAAFAASYWYPSW